MIDTENLPEGVLYRSTWGNYKTEARREFGSAARRNRARFSGVKVHRLVCTYVVGLIDEAIVERVGTFGETFRRTGKPVLFSCHLACGCTSDQHAGQPDARLCAKDVTCTKCGGAVMKHDSILTRVERAVLALLIAELAKSGWKIHGINDGDGFKRRTTEKTLTEEVFDLDDCWIYFNKLGAKHWVRIVRGNDSGETLISDYSYSSHDDFNAVLKRVHEIIESSPLRFEVKS